MKRTRIALAIALTGLFSTEALAQSVAFEAGRNINQQQRTEQGIRSGQLSNREAGRLERGQARAGVDGHIGRNEQRQIRMAENRQSRQISHERHDGQHHR